MRFVLCGDFWFLRFLKPVRYAKNRNKNTVRFQRIGWKSCTVCVCTGGERASAGKSDEKQRVTSVSYSKVRTIRVEIRPRNFQENDGKAGKRTYHTVFVAIPIGTSQKCRLKRPKGMVPYGGKNKPVRFSGMWETVVESKIPYGIFTRSPVRWFVNNRTGYMDM